MFIIKQNYHPTHNIKYEPYGMITTFSFFLNETSKFYIDDRYVCEILCRASDKNSICDMKCYDAGNN